MKTAPQHFLPWLMSLTTITRYFVIALLVHIAVMFGLAVIKFMPLPKLPLPDFNPKRVTMEKDSKPIENEAPYGKYHIMPPETWGDGGGQRAPRLNGLTIPQTKTDIRKTAPDATPTGPIIAGFDPKGFVRPDQGSIGTPGPVKDGKLVTAAVIPGDPFKNRPGWGPGNKTNVVYGTPPPKDTEASVIAGLRWLKSKQHPDGSWDGPYDRNGNTALAVLAFLGHGETTESPEFGETVNTGLIYLAKIIGPDGLVPGYSHRVYSQGAVTLALAEGYGMTSSVAIKESLERAVKAILAWQNSQGGWRYQFKSADSDVSTSGWMIMALKSARLAGIEVPEEAFDRAASYLWSMYHPSGGFGYSTPAQRPSTTAIGVLCLQYMKRDDDKRITKSLDYLKTFKADWQQTSDHGLGLVLYWWYYHSQAMFQAGGDYWKNWRTQLSAVMVNNQQPDGHWEYPDKSSFEKNFHETGYVYSTALCCLNLEVFYRYLPLHRELDKHRTALASR